MNLHRLTKIKIVRILDSVFAIPIAGSIRVNAPTSSPLGFTLKVALTFLIVRATDDETRFRISTSALILLKSFIIITVISLSSGETGFRL
jgi:hypothetical protein